MYKIYKITNIINNRKYVGLSKDFERRKVEHIRTSKNLNHQRSHLPLYKDMRRYGVEKFKFSIIDAADSIEEGYRLENEYILKFDTIGDGGYNTTITYHNDKSKKILIEELENKNNVSREKLLEELKVYNFKELGEIYNVSDNTVRRWCKRFDIPTNKEYHDTEIKRERFSDKMREVAFKPEQKNKKAVIMFDKDTGEYLREFESIYEAGIFVGGQATNISKSIRGIEGRKSAYGYRWEFS